MSERFEVTEEGVRKLAAAGELPLEAGREAAIAAQLSEWLTAANELSAKMSAEEHRELQPATVFRHPEGEEAPSE